MMILQNWLMHGSKEEPLIEKLEGIDILYKDYD